MGPHDGIVLTEVNILMVQPDVRFIYTVMDHFAEANPFHVTDTFPISDAICRCMACVVW